MCCFGEQENRDLSQSLLGDPKHVTKVEATAILSSTREVSDSLFSKHTEYYVQLHATGAKEMSCWKRYSDFEALYSGMMENQPQMIAAASVVMPPKNIGLSNSREAKEMRRQNLEDFLRRVVSSATLLWSKDMQDFIGCDPSIVEQLNASTTDQQRHIKALWKAQLGVLMILTFGILIHFMLMTRPILQEEMSRKCATPNPGRSSNGDPSRSTPVVQSIPRSRSLGLGGGLIPDIISLVSAQPEARMTEVI